jgi:WD40 repeat protein
MVDLVKVWGKRVGKIVTAVSTSESGFYTAVASKDNHVYLFDRSGNMKWFKKTDIACTAVGVSPDANYVIIAQNYDVSCYTIDGQTKWSAKVGGEAKRCQISRDSRKIGVAAGDCNLHMFNDSGVLLWKYGTEGQATCVGLNRDATINAVGSTNGDVHVLDGLGTRIKRLDFPFDILSMDISGKGTLLLIGSYEKLAIVDLEQNTQQVFQVENWIKDVSMDHDPSLILVGSMEIVSFFDRGFNLVYNLSPKGWAHAVYVTSNGKFVVVGSGEDHVDLYENRDAGEAKPGEEFQLTREMWTELLARVAALEGKGPAPRTGGFGELPTEPGE